MGETDQKALNRKKNIEIAARMYLGGENQSSRDLLTLSLMKRQRTAQVMLKAKTPEKEEVLGELFDMEQDLIKQLLGLSDEPVKSELMALENVLENIIAGLEREGYISLTDAPELRLYILESELKTITITMNHPMTEMKIKLIDPEIT